MNAEILKTLELRTAEALVGAPAVVYWLLGLNRYWERRVLRVDYFRSRGVRSGACE
jgi:hypothetical protein